MEPDGAAFFGLNPEPKMNRRQKKKMFRSEYFKKYRILPKIKSDTKFCYKIGSDKLGQKINFVTFCFKARKKIRWKFDPYLSDDSRAVDDLTLPLDFKSSHERNDSKTILKVEGKFMYKIKNKG